MTRPTVLWKADAALIGAGPAGLAAGIYLARAGWNVLILDEKPPGGQARSIERIENFPGFPNGISGQSLMNRFAAQTLRWGARFLRGRVERLAHRGGRFDGRSTAGNFESRAVILCSGAAFKALPACGKRPLAGIHHGAFESAPRCRGRRVAVVGGGDAAVHQALLLARYAERVTLICRGSQLKTIAPLRQALARHPRVIPWFHSVVSEVSGKGRLRSVSVRHIETNESRRLDVDDLFVLIGKTPDLSLAPWKAPPQGFFMAGDVCQGDFRQVAVAAGDGVKAAMACERFLHGDR